MIYLLKKIADLCDDAPAPREAGSLTDFQHRLDDFDERMGQILALAHQLDRTLAGMPHVHVNGRLAGYESGDTCALCGHDIRSSVHVADPRPPKPWHYPSADESKRSPA